jgi:hypothetical protein
MIVTGAATLTRFTELSAEQLKALADLKPGVAETDPAVTALAKALDLTPAKFLSDADDWSALAGHELYKQRLSSGSFGEPHVAARQSSAEIFAGGVIERPPEQPELLIEGRHGQTHIDAGEGRSVAEILSALKPPPPNLASVEAVTKELRALLPNDLGWTTQDYLRLASHIVTLAQWADAPVDLKRSTAGGSFVANDLAKVFVSLRRATMDFMVQHPPRESGTPTDPLFPNPEGLQLTAEIAYIGALVRGSPTVFMSNYGHYEVDPFAGVVNVLKPSTYGAGATQDALKMATEHLGLAAGN